MKLSRHGLFFCALLPALDASGERPTGQRVRAYKPFRIWQLKGHIGIAALLVIWLGCGAVVDPAADETSARDSWEAYYLGGAKVGYGHKRESPISQNGRPLREITQEINIKVRRFGDETAQRIVLVWRETPSGELVEFENRIGDGAGEIVTRGKPVGDQLALTTISAGHSRRDRSGWSRDVGGFFAVDRTLEQQPMQPGERRTFKALIPLWEAVATAVIELEAIRYEQTALLARTETLLKIRTTTRLADGAIMEAIIWTDRQGRTWKTLLPGVGQEAYRTTRENALDPSGYASLDLGRDLIVKVDSPIENPHRSRRILYRVHLRNRNPTEVFPAGPRQTIHPLGPNTAELTVQVTGPGEPPNGSGTADTPPSPMHSAPNALVQSDDQRVVEMAHGILPRETDPWKVAQALERAVCDAIETKDFSQSFRTAAEVARSLEGDCTEHAVLLIALCRARQIPARAAMGLVYHPPEQGFAYHMWTEAWIHDQWYPLDATLGLGGIGAAHIKLSDSDLHGTGAFSTFLPVLHVMGQLKLDVVRVE